VRDRLTSDLGVYALSVCSRSSCSPWRWGSSRTLPDGLGSRQLVGLVVGYLLFIGAYTTAWYIYSEIDSREEI